jgi:hypothetical protein
VRAQWRDPARVMITVGIVYHHHAETPPFESGDSVTVVTHVNASANGETPWRGFGENHNALMETVTGSDWYVALNPDVAVTREDIIRLVEFAQSGGYAIAGPMIRTPGGLVDRPAYDFPSPGAWFRQAITGTRRAERHAELQPRRAHARGEPAWISGACMAIDLRGAARRFDERYFMYFEDIELCHRLFTNRERIGFCTDLVVDHETGWSLSDPLRWRKGVEFARGALLFAEKLDTSPTLMRAAGVARFGSRIPFRASVESELVGTQCVARGFLNPRAPGLIELARSWSPAHQV